MTSTSHASTSHAACNSLQTRRSGEQRRTLPGHRGDPPAPPRAAPGGGELQHARAVPQDGSAALLHPRDGAATGGRPHGHLHGAGYPHAPSARGTPCTGLGGRRCLGYHRAAQAAAGESVRPGSREEVLSAAHDDAVATGAGAHICRQAPAQPVGAGGSGAWLLERVPRFGCRAVGGRCKPGGYHTGAPQQAEHS